MSESLKDRLARQELASAEQIREDTPKPSPASQTASGTTPPPTPIGVTTGAAQSQVAPRTGGMRKPGIVVLEEDEAILEELGTQFLKRRVRGANRAGNLSLVARAGYRLLYRLLSDDPAAFEAALASVNFRRPTA